MKGLGRCRCGELALFKLPSGVYCLECFERDKMPSGWRVLEEKIPPRPRRRRPWFEIAAIASGALALVVARGCLAPSGALPARFDVAPTSSKS